MCCRLKCCLCCFQRFFRLIKNICKVPWRTLTMEKLQRRFFKVVDKFLRQILLQKFQFLAKWNTINFACQHVREMQFILFTKSSFCHRNFLEKPEPAFCERLVILKAFSYGLLASWKCSIPCKKGKNYTKNLFQFLTNAFFRISWLENSQLTLFRSKFTFFMCDFLCRKYKFWVSLLTSIGVYCLSTGKTFSLSSTDGIAGERSSLPNL